MSESKKVRIEHTRMAGLCSKGVKKFLQDNKFSWKDFIVNGIDIDRLKQFNDHNINKVLTFVNKDEN